MHAFAGSPPSLRAGAPGITDLELALDGGAVRKPRQRCGDGSELRRVVHGLQQPQSRRRALPRRAAALRSLLLHPPMQLLLRRRRRLAPLVLRARRGGSGKSRRLSLRPHSTSLPCCQTAHARGGPSPARLSHRSAPGIQARAPKRSPLPVPPNRYGRPSHVHPVRSQAGAPGAERQAPGRAHSASSAAGLSARSC